MKLATLTLLWCAAVPTQPAQLPNLDFEEGTQVHWQGTGFALRPGKQEPRCVTSDDGHNPGGKAMLRYVFVVPPGSGRLHFSAHAVHAAGCPPDKRMNVYLLGEKHRRVPKLRLTDAGWTPTSVLLPLAKGATHQYCWDVSGEVGATLQIVLLDEDERAGCHVVCSGFRIERADEGQVRQFAADIKALEQQHKLAPLAKFDSRNFTAWSNADTDFTAMRLRNCEALYYAFFQHFERKGFQLRPPAARLMVTVFDSQRGFEAYLGHKMPNHLVGTYHPESNRLVVYDLNQNHGVLANKEKALKSGQKIALDVDRVNYVQAVERWARDACTDANIATTMHEAAHQVSFNCGLLNRRGDMPIWLAEGLACYCEATDKGSWQGIGQPNPERLRVLAQVVSGKGKLIPLADLVGPADWRKDGRTLPVGYAQSWALFHLLMHERPKALREYLKLVHERQTPDHRLTDFRQAFGADLARLDRELADYVHGLVQRHGSGR